MFAVNRLCYNYIVLKDTDSVRSECSSTRSPIISWTKLALQAADLASFFLQLQCQSCVLASQQVSQSISSVQSASYISHAFIYISCICICIILLKSQIVDKDKKTSWTRASYACCVHACGCGAPGMHARARKSTPPNFTRTHIFRSHPQPPQVDDTVYCRLEIAARWVVVPVRISIRLVIYMDDPLGWKL